MKYLSQAVAQSRDASPGWWRRQADSICDFTRRQRCVVLAQITTPAALRLNIEPMADCGRYDSIRMLA